jgi:hypothetical protein
VFDEVLGVLLFGVVLVLVHAAHGVVLVDVVHKFIYLI